jgi:hypothetical protein
MTNQPYAAADSFAMNARFEKNVAGDFYTTGECLACELPEGEAPDLLAALSADNADTYFVRQPQTESEIERACSAAHSCCAAAIRYGGVDETIIRRLGNRPAYCDHLLPGGPTRLPWESEEQWQVAKHAYGRAWRSRKQPWWKRWWARRTGALGE